MTSEFNLIEKYFTRATKHADLGVGDDAALVSVAESAQLVISTDMSVAGTHFYEDCAPYAIGWKCLAVNVSDMAAMGANPKWATLAIALPKVEHAWLAEFSRGFFACADAFNIDLIGGDTTRGTLNISVTIMGEVSVGKALRRDGAKVGDDIWVSGQLGSAALGLAHLQGKHTLPEGLLNISLQALNTPQPRVALGLALTAIAHSCIDISDGLLADLGHILKASNVGAVLALESVPCLSDYQFKLNEPTIQSAILAGGDDYELCFTAPTSQREAIALLGERLTLPVTRVGMVQSGLGLQVMYQNKPIHLTQLGYDHFG